VYFAPPPGARAGEERQIELELADAALRRYPGAEVHYRRSYYASSSTPQSPGGNSEPAVVSRSATPDDPDRPHLTRRPGISQVPDSSREGPLGAGSSTAPPAPQQVRPAPTPASACGSRKPDLRALSYSTPIFLPAHPRLRRRKGCWNSNGAPESPGARRNGRSMNPKVEEFVSVTPFGIPARPSD